MDKDILDDVFNDKATSEMKKPLEDIFTDISTSYEPTLEKTIIDFPQII